MWKHLKTVVLLPFMAMVIIPTIIRYFAGIGGMAFHHPAPRAC